MRKKTTNNFEKIIFNGRFLLAPFFLGLVIGIGLLFIKFFQKLVHLATDIIGSSENDIIIGVLSLIDITLIGCLLVVIIFSGYEIFISKIDIGNHEDKPNWMGKIHYSGLKLKVIGAIVAISAIELLKTFMNISSDPTKADMEMYMWNFFQK